MICCSNLRKPSPATHPSFNCIRLFPSQEFQMHLHLKKCLLFLLSFQYFGSRRKYPTSPYMEFSVVFQFLPFLLFGRTLSFSPSLMMISHTLFTSPCILCYLRPPLSCGFIQGTYVDERRPHARLFVEREAKGYLRICGPRFPWKGIRN